jgi:acetoin utilization deacetylase AcuC-like enzyme
MHPERPERVGAVLRGIDDSGLAIERLTSPEILRAELALAHDPEYIAMIETFCRLGGGSLDMDTVASEGSWQAALTAAGGVVALTRELDEAGDAFGFAVARPPGHHALRDRAMGFCLFNNVAVAAMLLRSEGKRVAILDWDVHHGNGTQSLVLDDPGILYVSLHQRAFYPFDGQIEDIERGEAKGTTINFPFPAGTGGDLYRHAWGEIVIPVVREFSPDWVLVSSGYDGHVSDPLADMRLVAEDFGWMAAALADVHPPGRTVLALEGGYDLDALRQSTAATLQGLSGAPPSGLPLTSPIESMGAFEAISSAVSDHWSI